MQVPFRQGIVKSVLNFLQLTGNTVSISIPTAERVLVTFADGLSDYLISEQSSVTNAWAGPFQPGTDYWLYWDLDVVTGAKTYGFTLYAPVNGSTAPASPFQDQHWFDTSTNKLKVWNAYGSRWVDRVRVFAAKLTSASTFISMSIAAPSFEGTQVVQYASLPVSAGFLVFDTDGKAVRKSNGTFFTTEDTGYTGVVSSSRVRLGAVSKDAEAMTTMGKNTIVVFTDFDKISPAEPMYFSHPIPFGIVEESAVYGQIVNVITEGTVSSLDWDWTPYGVNAPLYVGVGGSLSTVATSPAVYPVAVITGKHTIQLGVPSTTIVTPTVSAAPMTTTTHGGALLSVAPVDPLNPVVVGSNDPRILNAINRYGDTMVGILTLNATCVSPLDAANKQYVDTRVTMPFNNQPAGVMFAGPSTGAAAAPAFRSLVATDLPLSGVVAGAGFNRVTVNDRGIVTAASFAAIANTDLPLSGVVAGAGFNRVTVNDRGIVTAASFAAIANTDLPLSGATAGIGYNTFTVNDRGIVTAASTTPYITTTGAVTDGTVPRYVGTTGQSIQSTNITVGTADELSGYKALFNAQIGLTYILTAGDTGKVIDHTNAASITVTLPNNLPVGFCCTYVQTGAGQITFAPDVGAVMRNRMSHTKTAGQWAAATLYVRTNTTGTNAEYVLAGDTAL